MLAMQLCALDAAFLQEELQSLYDLPNVSTCAYAFSPTNDDMVSHESDVPMDAQELDALLQEMNSTPYVPTLLTKQMFVDDASSKGGVIPSPSVSFFAANTTHPPTELTLQFETRQADSKERFSGPSDIWKDEPTLQYIFTQGSTPGAMPVHDLRRVTRRAKSYLVEQGALFRVFKGGICKEVPPPEKREALIRHMHEKHGHFGVKRTTALLYPAYYWHSLGLDVRMFIGKCQLCDRVNTSFNITPRQLSPLPIMGIFYRWGVDLAGPFNPVTTSGNRYVMVMVEHFSKFLDVVAIPGKSAAITAQVFTECVLCRFGSCAEVVTDGGTEFAAEFDEVLKSSLIDHRKTAPNHPQADGLAERAVQTVKRALRKYCEQGDKAVNWDQALPWLKFGYNCSAQASTRMSPYYMLYARHPIIPPAHVQHFAEPIDLHNVDEAALNVYRRAKVAKEACIIAGGNLLTAQQRDTLRYAKIRGGGYLPSIRQFEVGDFVYLRRRVLDSTLQISAKKEIYRVKMVQDSGAIQLQGKCGVTVMNNVCNVAPCHLTDIDPEIDHTLAKPGLNLACEVCAFMDEEHCMLLCDGCGTGWHTMCLTPKLTQVPKDEWLCPRCTEDGVTINDLRAARRHDTPEVGQLLRGKPVPLFKDAKFRRTRQELRAFDGRTIAHRTRAGSKETAQLGVVRYMGDDAGNKCFRVLFRDGSTAEFSATEIRNRLMPEEQGGGQPGNSRELHSMGTVWGRLQPE